jgi:hypothetical protein
MKDVVKEYEKGLAAYNDMLLRQHLSKMEEEE